MITYNASFTGRTKQADGIFYPIKTKVEGENLNDAVQNLYKQYEHIRELELTEEK